MAGANDHFQVNSADLVRPAGEIDAIGDELTTAQQAGGRIRTDSGAYGPLCQLVPALLNGLQQALVDGIAQAAVGGARA